MFLAPLRRWRKGSRCIGVFSTLFSVAIPEGIHTQPTDKRRKERLRESGKQTKPKTGCHDANFTVVHESARYKTKRKNLRDGKHSVGLSFLAFFLLPCIACFRQRIYFQNHAERARVSPSAALTLWVEECAPCNQQFYTRCAAEAILPRDCFFFFRQQSLMTCPASSE